MNRLRFLHPAAALLPLALALAACGSHDDPQPVVTVPELAAGVHAVGTGDEASPGTGKYYAAADGTALLILDDANEVASAMYRREGRGAWQATPAAREAVAVQFLGTTPMPSATVSPASLAGRYVVRLADGAGAAFTLDAAGEIAAAGSGACRLSGKAAASPLPNVLKLRLDTSGCGNLPAAGDGYLVLDADHAPARFRLVAAGGTALTDLWAYAE